MKRSCVRVTSLAAIFLILVLTRAAFAQCYTYTTLDDPNGPTSAVGINNNGEIVGSCYVGFSNFLSWNDGFVYSSSAYTTLDKPGYRETILNGINDRGDIVGYCYFDLDVTPVQGFLYDGSSYTTVDDPNAAGAWVTYPTGINDSGLTVGYYCDWSGSIHGFLYDGSFYITLDDPNGVGKTYATGINGSGEIVGYYYDNSGGAHGFLYDGTTYTTLDDPNGVGMTYGSGINDSGDIVGYYYDNNGGCHGFLYDGSTYITLDDPNGVGSTSASGINASGNIVGSYMDSSSISHGFLANQNSLWQGAQDLGNGLYYLDWFGYCYTSSTTYNTWIYNYTFGWLYPYGTMTDGVWFWDPAMNGFWWTSQTVFPYIYRARDKAWLWYDEWTNPPRFYNIGTHLWEDD